MRTLRFAYVFVSAFGFAYYVLMRSGLAGGPLPPSAAEVVFSLPLLVCSFILAVAVSAQLVLSRAGAARGTVLGVLGVTLMVAGYWTSALTRYDVVSVITEGQRISPETIERVPGSGYVGRYAKLSGFELELVRLDPACTSDGLALNSIEGEFMVRGQVKERQLRLGDSFSRYSGAMRMSIRDMGYSPLYELRTKDGTMVDTSFVYLKIFPPGREDAFRLLAPLTYYVRYVPQTGSSEQLLHLRIARNKDIIFNRDVKLGEEIAFENARMRFPEMRRWTILEIQRDFGSPLFWLGAILGLVGFARRSTARTSA